MEGESNSAHNLEALSGNVLVSAVVRSLWAKSARLWVPGKFLLAMISQGRRGGPRGPLMEKREARDRKGSRERNCLLCLRY